MFARKSFKPYGLLVKSNTTLCYELIKQNDNKRPYNRSQKLLRQTRKTASYLKPQAIENSFKRAYGEVEDNMIIYI